MRTLFFIGLLCCTVLSGCSSDTSASQEEEMQQLEKSYVELVQLSTSQHCTDANEWNFTAIGSKACGGPTGYIAYSSKINTALFLEKVKIYTNAQRDFNTKWGINSTCEVAPAPISIQCENGKAVLKY